MTQKCACDPLEVNVGAVLRTRGTRHQLDSGQRPKPSFRSPQDMSPNNQETSNLELR